MVQIIGLPRGPDRRTRRAPPPLRPGPRPPRQESLGDPPDRKHIAASVLFHLAVLFGIFLLPHAEPAEVIIPLVTLRLEESGAAGSAGGKAGGGGGGGHGSEASSAASQSASAEPPAEASEQTPATPVPPTPTPPTPNVRPEPQVPQALAPAPVILPPPPKPPPPKPLVRPRPPAAKPSPRAPEKVAEAPTPAPAPTAASEPPSGPSNGQGAPAPNAQPGTAATGTANAGPGGAAGVGTGAAGTGRGSFGNGKGTGDDYFDRVRSWMLKYRKRPPDGLKQERSTVLRIALARDGTVLDAQIVESSGVPVLDQMALDWVHRASPVPPVPPEIPDNPLKFRMPFDFRPSVWDRLF